MKKIALLGALMLLGGCATSSKLYMPDGRVGYVVTCSGAFLNWGMCVKKVSDICGANGYDVYAKEGDSNFAMIGFTPATVINRQLMVACRTRATVPAMAADSTARN